MMEAYKEKYNIIWNEDLGFSQKFMPQVKQRLDETKLPKQIRDNQGTELDFQGHDLTIKPLNIGVRIRRHVYHKYDDFTEDEKERATMADDVYFLGFAYADESGLKSYIIFDHPDFRKARDNNELTWQKKKNDKHSQVSFYCYSLKDIKEKCRIYNIKEPIGWIQNNKRPNWAGWNHPQNNVQQTL